MVVDNNSGIINFYDLDGNFLDISFDGSNGYSSPKISSIAIENDNQIIAVNSNGDVVNIFTSNGDFVSIFDSYDKIGNHPALVAVDNNNRIMILDAQIIIHIFESNGTFVTSFDGSNGGTKFGTISSITVDRDNRIIVVDIEKNIIQIFESFTPAFAVSIFVDDEDCDDTLGNPFCTIQAAIDSTSNGDIIEVASGTYVETISIENFTDLILNGEDNITTIIKPNSLLDWDAIGFTSERKVSV